MAVTIHPLPASGHEAQPPKLFTFPFRNTKWVRFVAERISELFRRQNSLNTLGQGM